MSQLESLAKISLKSLEDLLQSLEMGGVILDSKQNILFVNEAIQNILGFTLDELKGKSFDLLRVQDKEEFRHKFGFLIQLKVETIPILDFSDGLTLYLLKNEEEKNKLESQLQKQTILLDAITNAQVDFISKKMVDHYEEIFNPLLKAVSLVTDSEEALLYLYNGEKAFYFTGTKEVDPNLSFSIFDRVVQNKSPRIENLESPPFYNIMAIPLTSQQRTLAILVLLNQKEGFTPNNALEILPATQSIVELLVFIDQEKSELEKVKELKVKENEARLLLIKLGNQNRELMIAKKKAEDAKASQTAFLGNISHEIRTPLNAIMGMSELMLNFGLTGKVEKYTKTIYQSSETLLALVNDLLDITKIEEGHLSFDETPFDFCSLIQEVILLMYQKALDKEIFFDFYYPPGIPRMIRSDPVRIRQVLLNLIGNAIKFTEKGYVVVFCELTKIEESLATIRVLVSDSGIGIAEDKHQQIFEKFRQNDFETTRKYGGTGLGLYISKLLIGKMGGTIDLQSILNKGSTFSFNLTFERENEESDLKNKFQNLKILIIDNNLIDAFALASYAQYLGMETFNYSNFDEALQKLQYHRFLKHPFDLVIYGTSRFDSKAIERLQLLNEESSIHPLMVFCTTFERTFDQLIAERTDYPVRLIPMPSSALEVAHEIELELKNREKRS